MPSSPLVLSDEDRATLEYWTRCRTVSAGYVERARIVLAIADGAGTSATARSLGVSRPTVIKWRERFLALGLDGLDDRPRSGRPKRIDDAQIIAATLEPRRSRWRSRIGPRDCWASSSPSATRRSRARGAPTGSNRGAARRSNSPPTPSWRPK